MRAARAALVVSLLGLGLAVQLHFFAHYPQPTLFGDPAGYLHEGHRWQKAIAMVRAGEGLGAAGETLRGGLLFAGVGVLFGTLDALAPNDWRFFRIVFAVFNMLGMAGAFFLARRLSGSFAGGVAALAMAALHPSFATHTGRMYPDPVTGCLFVWAAFAYASGVLAGSVRWMAAAGFLLTLGLFVRSQLMSPLLVLAAVLLVLTAPRWARPGGGRRLVGALVAGMAPLVLLWIVILCAVGAGIESKVAEDNFAHKQLYPYGFWQFLETDGWEGPFRLKTEPYYRAMQAEATERDPELLRSRPRQLAFTLRYVASRPWESLLLVLDNAYRLYDRPANPYQWDYPFPLRYHHVYQKAILVLSVSALAAFASTRPALAGVFFVPLSLALLHGVAFPWPRYAFPGYLVHIGAAGAFVGWALSRGFAVLTARRVRPVLAAAMALLVLGLVLADPAPEVARAARILGGALALMVPFAWIATVESAPRARLVCVVVYAGALLLVTAHTLRDRRWHETQTRFGGRIAGAEQEIRLTPEALARLRAASEAFVVFDLHVPDGDPKRLAAEVDGRRFVGAALVPTMPRLREATATGGRDRRGYPQWWAVPLTADLLPKSAAEPLRVRFYGRDGVGLRGDRFRGQTRVYEGPSFGDWPHFVAGKLEYDSEYRIGVRRILESAGTRSAVFDEAGRRTEIRGVHRIRVVVLDRNEGGVVWESAPTSFAPAVAFGFAAYSGARGEADLLLGARTVARFPLGAMRDFDIEAAPFRLCQRAEGLRSDKPYGRYFLIGPPPASGAVAQLAVRFRTGMSLEPRFFQLDQRKGPGELFALLAFCRPPEGTVLSGVERVVDASRNNYPEDTGRWTLAAVY